MSFISAVLSLFCLVWSYLWPVMWVVAGVMGVVSVSTFLLSWVGCYACRRRQNLKTKYNCEWGLVTGASSGIGLAIAKRLAEQGMNVVLVALKDKVFDDAAANLRATYPAVEFRTVEVNLATSNHSEFMDPIVKATSDITPQVVVLNAGYIVTGFYADTPIGRSLANFNCNAGCVLPLSHHFINRMRAAKLRGCVAFTSSPAGFMPCPFSSMYGATKAFLTEFASSIAPELRCEGIEVACVHPSPVTSNFYASTSHKIDALEFFKSTGTTPATIADAFLRGVGRTTQIDQGYYSLSLRFLLKLVDVTFLGNIITMTAHTMGDFKRLRAETDSKKA